VAYKIPQGNMQELKQSLEKARQNLATSIQWRDHYNLEIVRNQNVVRALAVAVMNAEKAEQVAEETRHYVGIAQAVEAIVNGSQNPISPVEVRDTLIFYGYDIGRYSNPLSMVHQTMRRLADEQRIQMVGNSGRYTRAAWYQNYYNAGGIGSLG